jgi:hypothetical protein
MTGNMNERLRQLVKQSRIDVYALGTDNAKWEAAVNRFAQSLIQECLLSLEPDPMAAEIDYDVELKFYQRSAGKIKRHFGIKE